MLAKLIRIYTPFLFAIIAIIHGVLYLLNYQGVLYNIFADLSGHSVFAILYIIATSKRMCKWYKATNILLLSVHIVNILNVIESIPFLFAIQFGLILNITALMCFIIFLTTRNVIKVIC